MIKFRATLTESQAAYLLAVLSIFRDKGLIPKGHDAKQEFDELERVFLHCMEEVDYD